MRSSCRASMLGLLAIGLGLAPGADPDEPRPGLAGEPSPVAVRVDASKGRGVMKPV